MALLFRKPGFGFVWLAGLISYIGDWMFLTALGFYVYELTGLVSSSGLLFIAYIIPNLLLSSIAGVFVDRWNRKWVMIAANLIRAPLLLALVFVNRPEQAWIIYVVAFVESGITTFFMSAERALLPNLVGEKDLAAANALNTLNDTLGRLVGPIIGGTVLATFGLDSVVYLDSASYIIGGLLIVFVAVPKAQAAARAAAAQLRLGEKLQAFWQEWLAGLHLVRQVRPVSALFIMAIFTELANSIINVLIVVFVFDLLQETSREFGWMMTARGIGGLIGGVVIAQIASRLSPSRLIIICLFGIGVGFLITFNNPILLLALLMIVVIGIFAVGKSAGEQTILQSSVTDEYRGRVFGFYGVTIAFVSLLGTGMTTTLGDMLGTELLLNVAGTLFLIAGILGGVLLREKSPLKPLPQVD